MDLELTGRVAIVCGASQGMGRAVAEGLAAEGARLALCARNADKLELAASELTRRHGEDRFLSVAGDLTRPETCQRLVNDTLRKWGRVDVLFNNLGGPPAGQPLDFDETAWLGAFGTAFLTVVRMCSLVVPGMRERKWGRVINMLAVSVKQVEENLALSSTVRSAVVAYGKGLSDQVARDGVTVNNVLPGSVATDRLREVTRMQGLARGEDAEQAMATRISRIPAGRLGKPEEMADLVCFLASERAAFINGASIALDGGQLRTVL